jgi:hypothetical protein
MAASVLNVLCSGAPLSGKSFILSRFLRGTLGTSPLSTTTSTSHNNHPPLVC